MESTVHLFLHGEVANNIWTYFANAFSESCHVHTLSHMLQLWWMKGKKNSLDNWFCDMLPPLIIWNIWKARNICKFEDVPMSVHAVLESIRSELYMLHMMLVFLYLLVVLMLSF